MSFALITGNSGAAALFGDVFPECGTAAADNIRNITAPECAVIFGEDCRRAPRQTRALAAVISSDSSFDTSGLVGVQVITCGASGKNTVSVTSRTADSMTLSLNRSIQTLRGICEPLELPVPAPADADAYDYMAAFAASLALGLIG